MFSKLFYPLIFLLLILVSGEQRKIDFGKEKYGSNWIVVNDGVMGGLSRGQFKLLENSMEFSGVVSLENNGGFSSLRAPYDNYDLTNFKSVEIRYRSKGQGIGLTLATSKIWFRPNYKAYLPETNMEWQTVTINLTDIKQYSVGRSTGKNLSKETLKNVIRYGFITSDKKASSFLFEVDYLKFH